MSEVKKTPKELELEWEKKYGGMTERERNRLAVKRITVKVADLKARKAAAYEQEIAKYDTLSYGDLVRAVDSARKKVSDLKGMPEQLREKKRVKLNKEFEHLEKLDKAPSDNKELWVSDMLLRYMSKSDGDYYRAKAQGDSHYLYSYCEAEGCRLSRCF